MTKSPRGCSNKGLIISGFLLFILGILISVLKTWILSAISPSFVLEPNTMIEEYWRKPPIEVPTDVYLFNWTNYDEIYNPKVKPKFQELGPYRFMQNMEKVNIIWNDNNTVTFNQVRTLRFDEDHSNGNLSENVVTLNAVTAAGAYKARYWNYWTKTAISTIFTTIAPDIFVIRTVNELLWEGYDDPIMEMFKYLPFLAPEVPRFDKFGWFRMRNGSASFDGVFNMANGIEQNYDVRNWNYRNRTSYFRGSCSKVKGSAGELYPRKPSRDYIRIFYSDMCRYLDLEYEKDVFVNGILGFKYVVGERILDNGTNVKKNRCYCTGDCIPSGVLNATKCRYGLPAFISLPHFYAADPDYLDAMDGLEPKKEKHQTYITLEPVTGSLLEANLRLQLNTLLQPVEYIAIYEDVPKVYFPLFWVQQRMELPQDLVPLLKLYLNAPFIFIVFSNILITLGLCLLLIVLCMPFFDTLCKKCRTKSHTLLKPEDRSL